MQWTFLSHSPEETERLGEELAELLQPGDVLALCGELGSGKTCFVRGVARGLGVDEGLVASPSFTLVNEYPGRMPLYHVDFYRLRGMDDVESIGFREYLASGGAVAVEWADRVREAIPPEALWIHFTFKGDTTREIAMRGEEGRGRAIVEALYKRG